jgi:ATP-dependent Zn protease
MSSQKIRLKNRPTMERVHNNTKKKKKKMNKKKKKKKSWGAKQNFPGILSEFQISGMFFFFFEFFLFFFFFWMEPGEGGERWLFLG